MLANVSVEYLTKLERGNATGVSDAVLEAVAQELQLDVAETSHLFDLARGARTASGSPRRPTQQRVRPSVQQLLDAMPGIPAFVQNGRLDILAANSLAQALYSELYSHDPDGTPNGARFVFLDERSVELYPDWNKAAADTVAALRAEAGRHPTDRRLNELLGQLSHSDRFSALWAGHNVRWHANGTKRFQHPVVGELTLAWEGLELAGDPGQALIAFTAEPGSTSAEALSFLASWASSALTTTPPATLNAQGRTCG